MANGLICQETLTTTPKYKIKSGYKTPGRSKPAGTGMKVATSCSPPDYLTARLVAPPPPYRLTPSPTPSPPPPYPFSTSLDLMCHEQVPYDNSRKGFFIFVSAINFLKNHAKKLFLFHKIILAGRIRECKGTFIFHSCNK